MRGSVSSTRLGRSNTEAKDVGGHHIGSASTALPLSSRKLREAMTDRPILFRGFDNIHEHVLRTDAGVFAQQLGGALEERFLLFEGARVDHGDLNVGTHPVKRSPGGLDRFKQSDVDLIAAIGFGFEMARRLRGNRFLERADGIHKQLRRGHAFDP